MIYDRDRCAFVLDSGREVAENGDFLLSPTADGGVCYGYDGTDGFEYDFKPAFTPAERAEIARYMTDACRRWAETGTP